MIKGLIEFYHKNYKLLLIIPCLLLVFALLQVGLQVQQTGSPITKGISLTGGTSITVLQTPPISVDELTTQLQETFPQSQVSIRELNDQGQLIGVLVETDVEEQRDDFVDALSQIYGSIDDNNLSVESTGAVLGNDFFRQTGIALLVAFIFMGIVVMLFFRSIVPSGAIVLAAFSDIIVTVAVTNIIGMKFSTAGIAALLMLVGYAVDTNILLSNKLLKNREGTAKERINDAAKTGLLMSCTTFVAVMVTLIVVKSDVIQQIMTVLAIGLVIDMIMTYLQNATILRLYVKKHEK